MYHRNPHVLVGIFIAFLLLYTGFWFLLFSSNKYAFFPVSPVAKNKDIPSSVFVPIEPTIATEEKVLAQENAKEDIPASYKLTVAFHQQVFNLSCEFAAASAIIHHYTNDPFFAPANEETAEKELMKIVGISQNPNVGIRMGEETKDEMSLYFNLNRKFGGADYYGVHSPPFLDLFASYKLLAVPLDKNTDITDAIKKAVYSGHLVMTWIQIGYGQPIDIALTYGTSVPVVRGEHVVVVNGYDDNGVFVMDPGSGRQQYISFPALLAATNAFALPFLEVYPSTTDGSLYEVLSSVNSTTGINRAVPKIVIKNGSGKIGQAAALRLMLQDFGYHIIAVDKADNAEYEDLNVFYKSVMQDYIKLLRKDVTLAFYQVASTAASLNPDVQEDILIIVGK